MELVALIVVVCLGFLAWSQLKRKGRKLPPGPYPLPIVGNIFQLQPVMIHRSLAQLAKKYGPLMSIQLGSKTNVMISSPEMAKEVLSNQSSTGRPIVQAFYSHDHNNLSMTLLPVGNQKWKDMRKICKEQIFANHSLEKSQGLRHKKHLQLIEYVQKCCDLGRAVNIREAAFTITLNLVSAALFSVDAVEFDSSAVNELKDIVTGVSALFSTTNYADYFPILKYFDPHGVRRAADLQFGRLFRHLQTHIDQRLESRRIEPNQKKHINDLLETLLDSTTPGSGYNLTLDDVKHLLFDLYFAGSESTATTLEWIMVELLNHPVILSKVKDEMRSVMGDRKTLHEADISRLPYLQAVIREVFRFRPNAVFLPHKAIDDFEINGYFIPKDTALFVNLWAISKDPSVWPNPESFEPERFLNNNIDFKGQNFELVPFGSGRRICPGLPLADRTLHTTVAALIHNFDWKFAPGQSELNGDLLSGNVLHREAPLMAIPMKP